MADSADAFSGSVRLNADKSSFNDLLPALQRLDRLLERAVTAAQTALRPRSLARSPPRPPTSGQARNVERLLTREPGVPVLCVEATEGQEPSPDDVHTAPRLAWLAQAFGLSTFDLDLILIALALQSSILRQRAAVRLPTFRTLRHPQTAEYRPRSQPLVPIRRGEAGAAECTLPLTHRSSGTICSTSYRTPPMSSRHSWLTTSSWTNRSSACCWDRKASILDWPHSAW